MDQRLVFPSLVLELAVAYWLLLPVLTLSTTVDLLAEGKLYVLMGQISLGLAATSLVLLIIGLLRRRELIPAHRRPIVGLSWLTIPGILFSGWWALDALWTYPEGCDPLTVWKCYFVQAGTYFGYSFFPAIAIPIIALVWASRIRTPKISRPAP